MPYRITITEIADRQLRTFPAREQRIIEAAVLSRLVNQPLNPSRAIKQLRSNPVAEYELRAGDYRILYNVEEDEVILLIVGRKVGYALFVEGEEFHGHQDDPAEPSGDGPGEDTE